MVVGFPALGKVKGGGVLGYKNGSLDRFRVGGAADDFF